MRIGRTLPPAAAPIGIAEIFAGLRGLLRGQAELERFRSELQQHFGVRHCYLVSSGRAALTLALQALKELQPGRDEVLIPAFTCYTVPSAVIRAGLKVRLCDLRPGAFDFDFARLAGMLSGASGTGRLLAVVPTHLFGFPADVAQVRSLLQDSGVAVVEDAAQAMGEAWQGRKLGALGDIGFFSLGRGKALSAVEGGVLLTDCDDVAAVLDRRMAGLPRYGWPKLLGLIAAAAALVLLTRPSLFWIPRALPFLRLGETRFETGFPILRMSPLQAGLTARWRERLEGMRAARQANAARWAAILENAGARELCFGDSRAHGLLRFPLRLRDAGRKRALLRASTRAGAGIMPAYLASINQLAQLGGEFPAQAYPAAEACARELVTLPTHGYVTPADVARIRRLLACVLEAA
jgi:dTDP-4-amino-4,6-dideoxygalactose transaminase